MICQASQTEKNFCLRKNREEIDCLKQMYRCRVINEDEDFADDDKMPDSESEFESDPEEDKFDIGKSNF